MRMQQRILAERAPAATPSVLWSPTDIEVDPGITAAAIPSIEPTDRYAVIDERVGDVIGVVASPWPSVVEGVLRFTSAVQTAWFAIAVLQETVDEHRRLGGQ